MDEEKVGEQGLGKQTIVEVVRKRVIECRKGEKENN